MPADWARVKTTLANSAAQIGNNALFQSVDSLITAAKTSDSELQAQISGAATKAELANYQPMRLVEVDVSGAPQSLELVDYLVILDQLVLFKDYTGNAGSNAITLVGAVEGVTDPQITSNFGTYKVYKSASDGLFHTW